MIACSKRNIRINRLIGRLIKYSLFLFFVGILVMIAIVNPYIAVVLSVVCSYFMRALIYDDLEIMADKMTAFSHYDFINCDDRDE